MCRSNRCVEGVMYKAIYLPSKDSYDRIIQGLSLCCGTFEDVEGLTRHTACRRGGKFIFKMPLEILELLKRSQVVLVTTMSRDNSKCIT